MLNPVGERRNAISLRQAITFSWPAFKKRYRLFTAVLLTFFGAWVALEAVVIGGQRFGIVLWVVAHLVFLLFVAGLEVGFLRICLALHDGGEPRFADTFAQLALGPKFLAGQILYLMMALAGLGLLIIPGVCLGVRYAMFGFSLASGETGLLRSFEHSATLTKGRALDLLAILAALLAFNVLGASLLGLGLLITVPLSTLMLTALYRQLSDVG